VRARVKIDPDRVIGRIDPNVYGQFMSRRPGCSEDGLYAPDSPTADEHGLRAEVVEMIRELRPPVIRWPGGCTGTSYHWLDGVGPRETRPKKIDLHFGWAAKYEFGTNEFVDFCRRIGCEPHLNFAMGTGTLDEAAAWVEYCNGTGDTQYANLRRSHGYTEPHGVRYWQLGNEMYGPWEIGYTTPREYGATAREWAKVLRRLDPSISLIAVGGTDNVIADWSGEVVPQVAPYVDYVSMHSYWRFDAADPWHQMMAGPHVTEASIDTLADAIRVARRKMPNARRLKIAVTEWMATPPGGMMGANPTIESFKPVFSLREALAVASFLNVMQRHCREVTLGSVAQTINVVGLIMVNPSLGGTWREPVYWPLWMQVHHSGPIALDAWAESPTFDDHATRQEGLAYLDCSATLDSDRRKLFLSLVNRHRDEPIELDVAIADARVAAEGTAHVLHHDNPEAMNGPAAPDNVRPRREVATGLGARFTRELLPHSYTVLELDL